MATDRLRFGIIGTGGRGLGSFARGLRNDFPDQADIVALSDMDPVRLALGAKHFEVERTDTDPSVVLDNPEVDVVVITTPDATLVCPLDRCEEIRAVVERLGRVKRLRDKR